MQAAVNFPMEALLDVPHGAHTGKDVVTLELYSYRQQTEPSWFRLRCMLGGIPCATMVHAINSVDMIFDQAGAGAGAAAAAAVAPVNVKYVLTGAPPKRVQSISAAAKGAVGKLLLLMLTRTGAFAEILLATHSTADPRQFTKAMGMLRTKIAMMQAHPLLSAGSKSLKGYAAYKRGLGLVVQRFTELDEAIDGLVSDYDARPPSEPIQGDVRTGARNTLYLMMRSVLTDPAPMHSGCTTLEITLTPSAQLSADGQCHACPECIFLPDDEDERRPRPSQKIARVARSVGSLASGVATSGLGVAARGGAARAARAARTAASSIGDGAASATARVAGAAGALSSPGVPPGLIEGGEYGDDDDGVGRNESFRSVASTESGLRNILPPRPAAMPPRL